MKIRKFNRVFDVQQWTGKPLGPAIAVDTETTLILSPDHIPDLIISCAYDGQGVVYIITNNYIKQFLDQHKDRILIFHNFPFDMNVLSKWTGFEFWDMIETDKILDTALLYKLVSIAIRGYTPRKWSLDYCVMHLLKNTLPKDNSIRLTFGQYLVDNKVDYKSMSKEHYVYATLDPIATFLIYENLIRTIKTLPTSTNLAHRIHLMGDIALDDIHRRGVQVDLEYTQKLRESLEKPLNALSERLATYGWSRGQKGNMEAYERICDFHDIVVPKSPRNDQYSMKEEDLAKYKHIPFVADLLTFLELELKHQFLNELTTERVHPWYDSIKNTGRTGCKKPNIQNPPRTGGIRECIIPKPGHLFADADYGSIEMYCMADHLKKKYKQSNMYNVLQHGLDPHIFVAESIYDCYAKNVTKDQRQASKIANYGFMANMSEPTFVNYAKQFGTIFTLDDAKRIKKGWTVAYPEMKEFWKAPYKANGLYVSDTGFVRANCSYTAWLNNHFQGKAAEGAKIALYMAMRSRLKTVMFVHDQFITEPEKQTAEDELRELKKIMISGMKIVCDMDIKVDGLLRKRHSK